LLVLGGMRVLVAGAGLAGLCAAREMALAGAVVTVLDARSRVGGRVWTVRDGFREEQYGELGAEFIDAEQHEIRNLVAALGLDLVRVLRHGFTHRFRTERGYSISRTAPWDALQRSLEPLVRRYKAARGRANAEPVRELSTLSLGDWLRRRGADREVHSMACALRGFFLADPDELSVMPIVEQIAVGGVPSKAETYRVVGGCDRVVGTLLGTTRARLLLQHNVRAISQSPDRVMAHVEDAAGQRHMLEADAMVVALPASTLRDIDLNPKLPENQWRAIRQLQYGRATKTVVQTSVDLFAGRRARAFATDGDVGAFWDGTEGQPRARSLSIVAFLGGGSASAALRAHAEAGARELLSNVCWLGRTAGVGTSSVVHCVTWEDDPWARGGYAFFDPGFDPSWRPLLSQRFERLVFAGEHTSQRWQGYMNGAVESGLRAARELIRVSRQWAVGSGQ
jgi:monoamine oxidase